MKKLVILLSAGVLMTKLSLAGAESSMPANPFGTVFAPWNAAPGGFSPLNNGFTSGGPMGMSPFAMSPFGSNGSPWGSMPSGAMPWNAWQPGSMMPWANQMPFANNGRSGNAGMMPWNGNNWGNMSGMPWGNGFNPWNNWSNGTANDAYYQNRNIRKNRDAIRTLLLMQQFNGSNSGGSLPGMTALPPPPGYNTPVTALVPSANVGQEAGTPQRSADYPVPSQSAPKNSATSPLSRQFDPFASDTILSPPEPTASIAPTSPAEPVMPERLFQPARPAAPQRSNQGGFTDPFSDPVPPGKEAGNSGLNKNTATANFSDPFAGDRPRSDNNPEPGLTFPEQNFLQ